MAKKALLVIDMLKDFVEEGAPLEVARARGIVGCIKARIEEARMEDIPIVYVCDHHKKDDPEFRVWPPHAVEGTSGADVVDGIRPREGDYTVWKTTYSGFFRTELDDLLKGLGVEEVILTGVCTNICVLYTAADAYMRGYSVTVPEECVAGLAEDDHRFALRQIKEVLKPRPTG
ncbi:MAG: cysteine hydrolase [Deltaproteobacteria bacterium]|nr:cysteine hydrolase [Deltaproteobacteria bacterium]